MSFKVGDKVLLRFSKVMIPGRVASIENEVEFGTNEPYHVYWVEWDADSPTEWRGGIGDYLEEELRLFIEPNDLIKQLL